MGDQMAYLILFEPLIPERLEQTDDRGRDPFKGRIHRRLELRVESGHERCHG